MPHNGPFYEPGVYTCSITEQALGENSKGNSQIVLRFRVLAKVENDGSHGEVAQWERTSYMVITDKTVERVCAALAVLGYSRDSFKFIDPAHPQAHSFVNVEAEFVCNHETYENNVREKWYVRTPREAIEVKPLEGKRLRELDNLFGKALKAAVSTKTATTAVKEPPPSGDFAPSDDDVPF